MKGFEMYTQIQQLKERGFKQASVAAQLGIHRKTIRRYWDMAPDEFEDASYCINRVKLLQNYQDIIIKWLYENPTMSAAQVCDWLKEHYNEYISERTVSRFVKDIRNEYQIKKIKSQRDYVAVPDLPPGLQLQVDFGEKLMPVIDGGNVRVRFVAFVLSCSRYKYVSFQLKPFTSPDLVRCFHDAFCFYGGMPHEVVLDQDHLMTVSENYGDIIFTSEFEKLRQECKFGIYLCRKADPESKGKIENVVKYVKQNFIESRYFFDEDILNSCCMQWLSRTANAKVHGTTKKIPAEAFAVEREHLRPLVEIDAYALPTIERNVRPDNTIWYDSNRYSVPIGTHQTQGDVTIKTKDGILSIMTIFGDPICQHPISQERGVLVQNTDHKRDKSDKISAIKDELNACLYFEATRYLDKLHQEKARYARDQFQLLMSLCESYGPKLVLKAIRFCENNTLWGATYVKDFLLAIETPLVKPQQLPIPVSDRKYHVTTQKRDVSVYAKAGGGQ